MMWITKGKLALLCVSSSVLFHPTYSFVMQRKGSIVLNRITPLNSIAVDHLSKVQETENFRSRFKKHLRDDIRSSPQNDDINNIGNNQGSQNPVSINDSRETLIDPSVGDNFYTNGASNSMNIHQAYSQQRSSLPNTQIKNNNDSYNQNNYDVASMKLNSNDNRSMNRPSTGDDFYSNGSSLNINGSQSSTSQSNYNNNYISRSPFPSLQSQSNKPVTNNQSNQHPLTNSLDQQSGGIHQNDKSMYQTTTFPSSTPLNGYNPNNQDKNRASNTVDLRNGRDNVSSSNIGTSSLSAHNIWNNQNNVNTFSNNPNRDTSTMSQSNTNQAMAISANSNPNAYIRSPPLNGYNPNNQDRNGASNTVDLPRTTDNSSASSFGTTSSPTQNQWNNQNDANTFSNNSNGVRTNAIQSNTNQAVATSANGDRSFTNIGIRSDNDQKNQNENIKTNTGTNAHSYSRSISTPNAYIRSPPLNGYNPNNQDRNGASNTVDLPRTTDNSSASSFGTTSSPTQNQWNNQNDANTFSNKPSRDVDTIQQSNKNQAVATSANEDKSHSAVNNHEKALVIHRETSSTTFTNCHNDNYPAINGDNHIQSFNNQNMNGEYSPTMHADSVPRDSSTRNSRLLENVNSSFESLTKTALLEGNGAHPQTFNNAGFTDSNSYINENHISNNPAMTVGSSSENSIGNNNVATSQGTSMQYTPNSDMKKTNLISNVNLMTQEEKEENTSLEQGLNLLQENRPSVKTFKDIWETLSPVTIQGSSLKTCSFSESIDRIQLLLKTDGRPLYSTVEIWHGPSNTPQKMKLYIDDGSTRPIRLVLETPRDSNILCIRNSGEVEFPIIVGVDGSLTGVDGEIDGGPAKKLSHVSTSKRIQGGSTFSAPFPPDVSSLQVMLENEGFPINARVEILKGPNNPKQSIEVYIEDGKDRPFYCVFETPEGGSVVRIINTSPVEFPLNARVEPYLTKSKNIESGMSKENSFTWHGQG